MSGTEPAYDAWHRQLGAREATERGDQVLDLRSTWHRLLLARLGDVRGLRVAEVGCGRGDLSIHLAQLGARPTAVDVSSAALEIGRRRALAANVEVEWLHADAQQTGLPGGAFDLVVSCECLEHVEHPDLMARELFRLTKPGGRCLLTTPSYLNGRLLAWVRHWLTGRPLNTGAGVQPRENFFLYPLVRRRLRRAGFGIVETEGRLLPLLLLPGVNPARLCVERVQWRWAERLAMPFFLHLIYDLRRPVG